MTSLINPNTILFRAPEQPYITPTEYANAPTAVDISQLVPLDTDATNSEELKRVIARACGLVDAYCLQPLGATLQTETSTALVRPDGTVQLRLDQFPVLEIQAVTCQYDFTNMTPQTLDPSKGRLGKQTLTLFPAAGQMGSPGTHALFSVTYVAGYVNAVTTASAAAADTQLALSSTLGIYTGTQLRVYDDANGAEIVTVSAVATNTITITPLTAAHPADVSVSALPEAVKAAAILMTSALVKTRGSEAIVMQSLNAPPQQMQTVSKDLDPDIALAKEFLAPFRRIYT